MANFPDKRCPGLLILSLNEPQDQYSTLKDLDEKIHQLVESCKYNPVNIFVTFDIERSHQNALN